MIDYELFSMIDRDLFGNCADIEYNEVGELKYVENLNKLNQDVQKIVLTQLREVHPYPKYGSGIHFFAGNKVSQDFLYSFLKKTITAAIDYIKEQQSKQLSKVPLGERIEKVISIKISKAGINWEIFVSLMTAAKTYAELGFKILA